MTSVHPTLNIEHMNYYKELGLDELGIPSEEEAEELEYELELRFEDFTPKEREIWLKQNVYLKHFSSIGTVTASARQAGVTVFTAQRWKHDNVLGFTRRLEVSELTFKDRLQQKALLRASDPTAPATLLIELLRATSRRSSPETTTSATPRRPTRFTAASSRTPPKKGTPATQPSIASSRATPTPSAPGKTHLTTPIPPPR